jgi:alkylation response protein AidB-like acyl-CoA dehydrogenase
MFELTAKTEAGACLVRIAESLAADFAVHAAAHRREPLLPPAAIEALQPAGYFAASVPVENGGLGVTSVHDLVVASSRLARGDASIAIGVNAHLVLLLSIVRRWRAAIGDGDRRRAHALAASINGIARDGVVMTSGAREHGQDLTGPRTVATRTPSGWTIDGREVLCTVSPAGTELQTSVAFLDDGVESYGYAQVPNDAAGVEVLDDCHLVTFVDVSVPRSALRGGHPAGTEHERMDRNLLAGLFHASVLLGTAERAWSDATGTVAAENAIDLSACRAMLARAATLADKAEADIVDLLAETHAAETFIQNATASIVDRALRISGRAPRTEGTREHDAAFAAALAGIAAQGVAVRRVVGDPAAGDYAVIVRAELGARCPGIGSYLLWSGSGDRYMLHCSDPGVAKVVASACDAAGVATAPITIEDDRDELLAA